MRPGLVASRSGNRIRATLEAGDAGVNRSPTSAATIRAAQPLVSRPALPRASPGCTSMSLKRVDIAESFARFRDPWSPKVVGELNGQMVKLVRFQGEFVWHQHEHEDEMFLV